MRWLPGDARALELWLRNRLPAYLGTAGWLIKDLVRYAPSLFVLVLGLTVVSVLGKLATFGALFVFAAARLGNGTATVKGLEITVGEGASQTALWAAVIVGLALLTAVTTYAAGQLRVTLGHRYALHAVREVMDRLSAPGLRSASFRATASDPTYVRRLIGGDAMLLVRTVQPVTAALLPLLQLLVAAALMVLISPTLTALLVGLGLAYAVPFYWVNRRIIRASKRRETTGPAFSRLSRSVAANVVLQQYAGPELRDAYVTSPEVQAHMGTLEAMLSNKYRVQRLNDVFLGFAALVMVGYLATAVESSTEGVLNLLAFVVVARFAYGSVNMLTRSVAGFNRFLPQFQRYVGFCRAHDDGSRSPVASPRGGLPMTVRVPRTAPFAGASGQLEIAPGVIVLCVQPFPVDGPRLRPWWAVLTGSPTAPGLDHVLLAADSRALPPLPLSTLLHSPPGADAAGSAALQEFLAATDVAGEVATIRGETSGTELLEQMSYRLRFVVAVAPAVALDKRVVVASRRDWEALSHDDQGLIRAALGAVAIVLTTNRATGAVPGGTTGVVVLDQDAVLGAGDVLWWKGEQPRVADWLARKAGTAPAQADLLGNDEDEDIEDA